MITLPGFLFFYYLRDYSFILSAFLGFLGGSFVWSTLEVIFAGLSLPGLLFKRKK
jgi:hypothetical protein